MGHACRQAGKRLLPESTHDWVRARSNPRLLLARMPIVQRTVDRWAARWALEALIVKTDDARNVHWLDRPIWQYPTDAWILQEMVGRLKPDLIVETGTHEGGSAFYLACLLDMLGRDAEVISVDIAAVKTIPHPRITYVSGSSTDPDVFGEVAARAKDKSHVLVILDSDHRAEHVLEELGLYSQLVPLGGYVHVQDGCVDELPVYRGHFPGPAVAARSFLARTPSFARDVDIERRYLVTTHPYGWLKRVAD